MNKQQIADFCERYFETTGCHIMEKTPVYMKVKLSPEADRELTGRPYYWNFVERTGAEAETMSFLFVFDPEARQQEKEAAKAAQRMMSSSDLSSNATRTTLTFEGRGNDESSEILGRYLGIAPIVANPGRTIEEPIIYGSRRLEQIFAAVCDKGMYVQQFEDPPASPRGSPSAVSYSSWLGVNYKIEYICDMKREELVSLGLNMNTGEIVPDFHDRMLQRSLSPRIPARTSLRETISLERAVSSLERTMEQHLAKADYRWAEEAVQRMNEEIERIDGFYAGLLGSQGLEEEQKNELESQYARRREEIEWQYRPRVEVKPIHCGWYHLLSDTLR